MSFKLCYLSYFVLFRCMLNDFRSLPKNETVAAKNSVKYLAVLIARILIWKYHTPFVVDKLCIAKTILSNLYIMRPYQF